MLSYWIELFWGVFDRILVQFLVKFAFVSPWVKIVYTKIIGFHLLLTVYFHSFTGLQRGRTYLHFFNQFFFSKKFNIIGNGAQHQYQKGEKF
jgi:hypothetical protein